MTDENKKPNDPDIWNKKPIASNDEIIVKVQRMFPNCQKYTKCCDESGMEEMMEKVKKVHNYKEVIDTMLYNVPTTKKPSGSRQQATYILKHGGNMQYRVWSPYMSILTAEQLKERLDDCSSDSEMKELNVLVDKMHNFEALLEDMLDCNCDDKNG